MSARDRWENEARQVRQAIREAACAIAAESRTESMSLEPSPRTPLTPLTDSDVAFIQETREKMKQADPEFRVSGSVRHRYEIGPPIPEEELRRFEEEAEVAIPADFRSFLALVGPGAGPAGGIFFWSAAEQREMSDLKKPFPYTEPAYSVVGVDESNEPLLSGGLVIANDNSGSMGVLVVNGTEYGMVWEQWYDDLLPSAMTFWQWYSRWLAYLNDFALPRLQAERAVDAVAVGMGLSEVMRICGPVGGKMRKLFRESKEYTLAFENLSTWIEFAISPRGDEDKVQRILRHGIYNPVTDFETTQYPHET